MDCYQCTKNESCPVASFRDRAKNTLQAGKPIFFRYNRDDKGKFVEVVLGLDSAAPLEGPFVSEPAGKSEGTAAT